MICDAGEMEMLSTWFRKAFVRSHDGVTSDLHLAGSIRSRILDGGLGL